MLTGQGYHEARQTLGVPFKESLDLRGMQVLMLYLHDVESEDTALKNVL